MGKIKKICAGVMAGIMTLSMSSYAENEKISISDFELKNGIVSVEITNATDAKTILTVILEKIDENGRIYGVYDKEMKANEKASFIIPIPDEIQGIKASGKYILKAQNSERERVEKEFEYADGNTINDFVDMLKLESEKVTDPENAYELILPLFIDPDNNGVLFSIGLDSALFDELDEEIQQDAINILYKNSVDDITADTLSDAVLSAFAFASYNSGEKEKAIDILAPTYGGKPIDDSYKKDVLEIMSDSYKSTVDFVKGFKESYGIETVNRSSVGSMESCLDIFNDETGLFESEINKIKKLSNKRVAYEYMVLQIDKSKLKGTDELESLLEDAYDKAKNSSGNGGTSGGGGGSVSNSVKPTSGSVTGAMGSGTFEEKVEATEKMIFADLSESHWAAESVEALKNKGIVNGSDTGEFEPDRAVTREEFTKMLIAACEFENTVKVVKFTDIIEGEWYVAYIATAVDKGIVKGISDDEFGIGMLITREDMAVMITRAMDSAGIEPESIKEYTGFDDVGEIADYATNAIEKLYKAGVVNGKGDNKFEPKASASRAEAAKIIYEAFKGGF